MTETKAKKRRRRKKIPCDVHEDFLDEIKDAVVWLQQSVDPTTSIRSFVENACRDALARVKKEHKQHLKRGKIPKRQTTNLRPGKPIS